MCCDQTHCVIRLTVFCDVHVDHYAITSVCRRLASDRCNECSDGVVLSVVGSSSECMKEFLDSNVSFPFSMNFCRTLCSTLIVEFD